MFRFLTLAFVFSSLNIAAALVQAQTTQKTVPSPMDKPYVKLFTLTGKGVMKFSDEQIEFLAKNYGWINTHAGMWAKSPDAPIESPNWRYPFGKSGGDYGKRLREKNPNIILTNYRMGSQTERQQLEAPEVERGMPLAIAVWLTSNTLVNSISEEDTVIELTPTPVLPKPSKLMTHLKEMPPYYPYVVSTTPNEASKTKTEFVGWFRIGNEAIRIDKIEMTDAGNIKMQVKRGIWGTQAAAHEQSSKILAPIYAASGWQGKVNGVPNASADLPAIRYQMRSEDPLWWKYLGDKIAENFDEGLNGPWFDCMTSSWIEHQNAYALKVEPYDVEKQQLLTRDDAREYRQRNIDYLFKRFPKGEFYVNWTWPQYYFGEGHERYLFSGENGHHPISGGSIEVYSSHMMDWHQLMAMELDMIKNKFRGVCWPKKVGGALPMDEWIFAYCTHLLAYEPDCELYFGSDWRRGEGPDVFAFAPLEFVYWDLGKALQRFEKIAEAERSENKGIYQRQFEKALVLVNPNKEKAQQITLQQEMYDMQAKAWVTNVDLQPRRAVLLLKGE